MSKILRAMAHIKSMRGLALLALWTASAVSQSSGVSTTLAMEASTTAAASTSNDVPLSLWSVADSLLSSAYPSTTLTALPSVPTTLVIGSSTYIMHSSTHSSSLSTNQNTSPTATTSVVPQATDSKTGAKPHKSNNDASTDKKLAIILGVVIGVGAFAVMGIIFCCLSRRRKRNGSFFLGRRSPSVISSGSDRWPRGREAIGFSNANSSYLSSDRAGEWDEKYARLSSTPQRKQPPMAMHPAFIREQSSRSTSDDNPFYTPEERSTTELDSRQVQPYAELDHHSPAKRRSSSSVRNARPPTPFSPMMMSGAIPSSHPHQNQQQGLHLDTTNHQNPFSSPEDEETDDVVSPILPTRSPERRHSPMVHYPSWSEVSSFDFSGEGRRQHAEDGGDGWHSSSERGLHGRYELA